MKFRNLPLIATFNMGRSAMEPSETQALPALTRQDCIRHEADSLRYTDQRDVSKLLATTFDHVRQAPWSLLLSGVALLLFAAPTLSNHLQFKFADHGLSVSLLISDLVSFTWPSMLQWRSLIQLIGCNWQHWSGNHLYWDLLMFYVVGSLCERRSLRVYAWTIALSAMVIPWIVQTSTPNLQSYRGLSGIDTALFALLATTWMLDEMRNRQWKRSLPFAGLLIGMTAKILYELTMQETLFVSAATFTPVPMAHLAGAVIGIMVATFVANMASVKSFCQ